MEVPLPWERVIWTRRARWPSRSRAVVTDVRIVCGDGQSDQELALQDIEDVERVRTITDRLIGTSTIVLHARPGYAGPLAIRHVRRGAQLAALLELLAGDAHPAPDADAMRAVLAWSPPARRRPVPQVAAGVSIAVVAVSGVAIALHGETPAVGYPADDAVRPGGEKRDRDAIVEFMETEVLPWAQATLGPLKGGPDRVGCETCHGNDPDARDWAMPSVAALPEPHVREYGSEVSGVALDAQMRNAMYGYLAEADNQTRAAYMRQVVVPGMARLLRRPAYDFTRTYEYNRTRYALGCYHCHRAEADRKAAD